MQSISVTRFAFQKMANVDTTIRDLQSRDYYVQVYVWRVPSVRRISTSVNSMCSVVTMQADL